MNNKKICDHCGRKVNGINNIANYIGDTMLCSRCYESLAPFKISAKYNNYDELNAAKSSCINKAIELQFSEKLINELNSHFEEKKKMIILKENVDKYLMTTGTSLEGYSIKEYLGIVSGQVVLGTGFLSGYEAGFADFFGSESITYTETLDEARRIAKNRAIKKSIMLGGNALIGVDIELTNFAKDMISVSVNGTSVIIEKHNNN